ncbi:MAG: helix-turn-helix domain-containing protein [Gemmatimonadota bacterium]|nr:helix-turn-helix domain-containing protein [Gemmatimonadota bacterium]
MSESDRPKEATYLIERADQLRAIASPVRHRIIAGFEGLGRCSVRDLAEHMGVAPESLYYHIKHLAEAGLIVPAGKRPTERRLAQLYELVSRAFEVGVEGANQEFRDAYADMAAGLLRWAGRAHAAALRDPEVRQSGDARERTLMQFHPRLNEEALAQLNRRLEGLEEFLRDNEDPGANQYAVTLVVSPTRGET